MHNTEVQSKKKLAKKRIAIGQFHDERDKVKINKYVYFHCKLIALTQTVLYVLGKNIFILLANLFSWFLVNLVQCVKKK